MIIRGEMNSTVDMTEEQIKNTLFQMMVKEFFGTKVKINREDIDGATRWTCTLYCVPKDDYIKVAKKQERNDRSSKI